MLGKTFKFPMLSKFPIPIALTRLTSPGCVVQASNLYLGLKTGFTFGEWTLGGRANFPRKVANDFEITGPQLFGAIFGYAILKPLSIALPVWLGGGYFGEKENVTCQSRPHSPRSC